MAGNANSGRRQEKPFADALRMEIADAGTDRPRLRRIAKRLLAAAEAGDLHAIAMLADRLDGKAMQSIEVDQTIEHKYVRAPAKASDDEWKQTLLTKTASGKPNADHKVN